MRGEGLRELYRELKKSLKEIPQNLEESDSPHGGGCGNGAVVAGNKDKDGGCHHHEILNIYFMYWYLVLMFI